MPENFCSKVPCVPHAVLEILGEEYKGGFNDLIPDACGTWYGMLNPVFLHGSSPNLLASSCCRSHIYPAALNEFIDHAALQH
jgi:hypothetical protein